MHRIYQFVHSFDAHTKHTITCMHNSKVFIELLCLTIVWNSVIAGPLIFQSETLEGKTYPAVNTSQMNNSNNTISSNENNETVATTVGTIEGTGDIVEIQTETCDDPLEEFVSPVRGTPRCCRKCEPGNGMLRLCSNTEDTQCRPCKPGFEFSPFRSATKKCLQCRRCEELHPLAKTRNECTPVTDTICQCEKPYYMSEKEQTCKPCTVCKPGEGIVQACGWNSDTQCQSCPAGFWSAQSIDNVKCIPCQSCGKDQILVKECSSTSDTLCCPVNNPNCTHELSMYFDYSAYDQESDISDNNNKSNQMLPIYCSIMGLIIISLLCYVVYKLWRQREASKNAKLADSYNSNKTDLLDRTSCLDNNHLQHRRISSGFVNNSAHLPNHSPQSANELNNIADSTPDNDINNQLQFNDIIYGHEKAPLLGKLDHSNSSFNNFEQPITVIPMNILGVICYRLSQHGWQELASMLDLETSKFDQLPSEITSDLLSATMEAQTTAESHLKQCNQDNSNTIQPITNNNNNNNKNNLTMTVSMFQYMCLQNTVNLGQLMNSLQKLNSPDLVALIQQQIGIIKSKKTINQSNEEYKTKTKSIKSKENFQIEN
uniref:TNFR n=1 Tax=Schistosoma mansoni TaxID=6183 RepID=D2IGB9_SCHMA|nr:TNFR [Schistosoma mansoni]